MSSLLTKTLEKPSPGDIVSVHTRHYVVACPPAMLWQWKDEMETRKLLVSIVKTTKFRI